MAETTYLVELVQLDVVVLLEDELDEPALDEVLPRVPVAHLDRLQLPTPISRLTVLGKLDLYERFALTKVRIE